MVILWIITYFAIGFIVGSLAFLLTDIEEPDMIYWIAIWPCLLAFFFVGLPFFWIIDKINRFPFVVLWKLRGKQLRPDWDKKDDNYFM